MSEDIKTLLGEARQFAQRAREFEPVAGAMFGGNKSTAQHKALADAVDRLAAVCETLADVLAVPDPTVRMIPPRFGSQRGDNRVLSGSELEVLLAWESGELSGGQACRLLGDLSGATTDPVTAREMRMAALASVRKRWEKWRACNPPSPVSGP